nr:MAG TPA: hypothetical protein [Caudoviricetes sp.]
MYQLILSTCLIQLQRLLNISKHHLNLQHDLSYTY